MRRVLEIPLVPLGDAGGHLIADPRGCLSVLSFRFPVSGKTMFLVLIKEPSSFFAVFGWRKERHEFNGKP
jgi:hypothetical protein